MNRPLIITLALSCLAGCGGDPPPPNTAGGTGNTGITKTKGGSPAVNAGIGAPTGGKTVAMAPRPAGARFTIFIARYGGSGHEAQARLAKQKLIDASKRNDVHIVHKTDESQLYMGFYREIVAVPGSTKAEIADAQRAEADLKMLKAATDAVGGKPYRGSILIPLPMPDPVAPPEWNLTNVDRNKDKDDPERKYWSIAIAAYTADAQPSGEDAGKDRKQLATEAVAAARAQGVEAYYYHGDNVSMVCVGAWPRKAIRDQSRGGADKNEARRARTSNENMDMVVAAGGLPKGMGEQLERDHNVEVFQPKVEVDDPSLIRTMEKYKEYSVNGLVQVNDMTDPKTNRRIRRPQPSFLVEIPLTQPSMLSTEARSNPDNPPPTLINPMGPAQGGRLRGVDR